MTTLIDGHSNLEVYAYGRVGRQGVCPVPEDVEQTQAYIPF